MLNPDFRDILSEFSAEQVEFMVVGAYALALHGYPRATGDIDLWIRRSDENALRTWRALKRFGAPLVDIKIDHLKTTELALQIGVAPRRIDILTSIDGVEFDEAWADRIEVDVGGLRVSVIGREHLLRNKRAADRLQDRVDVALLEGEGKE